MQEPSRRSRRPASAAAVALVGTAVVAFGGVSACTAHSSVSQAAVTAAPNAVPGWRVRATVVLPAGGQASSVTGSGRYRTFGWAETTESDDHQVGVADLRIGHVWVLPAADPSALTTGNWSDGHRVVRAELRQAGTDTPLTWRVFVQDLPTGAPRQVDASGGPVPFEGQPSVAFATGGPVWGKFSPACRCFQVVQLQQGDTVPVVLHQQALPLVVKGDGRRALVLSDPVRVIDPASGADVVLPVRSVTTGAIRGHLVVLFQPPTDAAGIGAGTLVALDVPTAGPPRVLWTHPAPVALDQVDFVDDAHLFLWAGGHTQVLDLRTRRLSPAPPVTDVAARYALGDGTLTTVEGFPGHERLVVWEPTPTALHSR